MNCKFENSIFLATPLKRAYINDRIAASTFRLIFFFFHSSKILENEQKVKCLCKNWLNILEN